jgi:hypothetical protein
MFEIMLLVILIAILGAVVWVASATYSMYQLLGKGSIDAYGEEMEMGLTQAANRAKKNK